MRDTAAPKCATRCTHRPTPMGTPPKFARGAPRRWTAHALSPESNGLRRGSIGGFAKRGSTRAIRNTLPVDGPGEARPGAPIRSIPTVARPCGYRRKRRCYSRNSPPPRSRVGAQRSGRRRTNESWPDERPPHRFAGCPTSRRSSTKPKQPPEV